MGNLIEVPWFLVLLLISCFNYGAQVYIIFLCLFSETFGDSNVGLITGDSAINKDAQVVIMTTEILRNMLYQRLSFIFYQACYFINCSCDSIFKWLRAINFPSSFFSNLFMVFSCSVGVVSSESGLLHVDVIVLDEVHYLSDISRGTVWEEIVRAFEFQVLMLSSL